MNKIVYIAGLGHSGSTLLGLLLSNNPQVITLGEIYPLLKKDSKYYQRFDQLKCSCGQILSQCHFWKDFLPALKEKPNEDYWLKYKKLMQLFHSKFGQDKILLDASKELAALQALKKEKNFALSVLYLLKDVRNYLFSLESKYKKASVFLPAVKWCSVNKKIKVYLEKEKLPYLQLGYEELCFYPEYILGKICRFLGIDFSKEMLYPAPLKCHFILGNRMTEQPEKLKGIFYDNRWFSNYKINFIISLLLPVFSWNNKNVYGNIKNYLWRR